MIQQGITKSFSRADYVALLLARGKLAVIPTQAGWTATVTGSGAVTQAAGYLFLALGATDSSTALATVNAPFGFNSASASDEVLDWGKKLYMMFSIRRTTTEATAVGRVQLKQVSTIGALAAKGIGIQIDNLAISGESYGTSVATVDLATTMTSAYPYDILIIHDPNVPKIEWWVGGVLKGTQSTAAKIPSGSSTDTFTAVSHDKGVAATDARLNCERPIFFQVR